jgi:tetratricopeptide (TPR) repeat protein
MSRSNQFHVFTPQRDNPEDLEKILVKRHDLLTASVEKVRASVLGKGKHHLLFVGPRGMGKSYLVTLIHHRLSQQPDLVESARFAWLNEDQTSTTFLHLLARIYRKLAEQYPQEFPLADLEAIRGKESATAREMLGAALLRHLGKRTIILLVENIDLLFRNMSEQEQLNWRAFIQNHPVFTTVATAQGLTDDLSTEKKPFYLFFDLTHLKALTVEEATELLEKIALLNGQEDLADYLRSSHGKARLRAIHHLSGGNPRLYFILSDFLTRESLENLVQVFEETVDRQLTPYFQERMRWLSAQQQEIVQFLCQQVHPASVKEIADAIFAKANTTSSQLKQLKENGYLISNQRGRESLYELAEPLMRLSFQVKEATGRQPLKLIVDFLRVWYDRADLEKRLKGFPENGAGRAYFEAALKKQNEEGYSLRHDLMRMDLREVDVKNCSDIDFESLRCLAEEGGKQGDWFYYGLACLCREDYKKSIEAFSQVVISTAASLKRVKDSMRFRALAYYGMLQPSEAIRELTAIIDGGDTPEEALVEAMSNRAEIYKRQNMPKEALIDCNRILQYRGIDKDAKVEMGLLRAQLLRDMLEYKDAISAVNKVLKMPDISLKQKAEARYQRGVNNVLLSENEKAQVDFSMALPDIDDEFRHSCLFFRGVTFTADGNWKEAISDLTELATDKDERRKKLSLLFLCRNLIEVGRSADALQYISSLVLSVGEWSLDLGSFDSWVGLISVRGAFNMFCLAEDWESYFPKIREGLSKNHLFDFLGQALTRQLLEIKDAKLAWSALDDWITKWGKLFRADPEMEIPLRLHRVGIEWIKTRDDDCLLSLVKEERAIVRQALGLEAEEA